MVLNTGMQISSGFRTRIHGLGFVAVLYSEDEYETEKGDAEFYLKTGHSSIVFSSNFANFACVLFD